MMQIGEERRETDMKREKDDSEKDERDEENKIIGIT